LTEALVSGDIRGKEIHGNPEMSMTGPSPLHQLPAVDGRQSDTALMIQRGVCRLLRDLGFAVLTEFTLASGRRADVTAVKPDGTLWIVEIKSSPEDFYADGKWPEYRDYCDQFFFAVSPLMDQSIMPVDAGLMVADGYGAEVMRQEEPHALMAARRKAVMLQFARVAAQRLHSLWDPIT
jgi:hypothetical protein